MTTATYDPTTDRTLTLDAGSLEALEAQITDPTLPRDTRAAALDRWHAAWEACDAPQHDDDLPRDDLDAWAAAMIDAANADRLADIEQYGF